MRILLMELRLPILKAFGLGVRMKLYEQIMAVYPELTNKEFDRGVILLRNDSDGLGDYIEKWEYTEPIPDGLSLGKPNA